ncbi:unnamed protein product, partial [Meganyctiphanes norvegica]
DVDYSNESDCESTPRSLMSPLEDYTTSHGSSDATSPPSLADMLDLHPSTPYSWDPIKSSSPLANQIKKGDLGFSYYTDLYPPLYEGLPAINSAMVPPMLDMFTQYQVPRTTNVSPQLLPAVTSSSQMFESSLNFVTHKNLYEEALINSRNSPKQQKEKKIWFDPIRVKGNIWA